MTTVTVMMIDTTMIDTMMIDTTMIDTMIDTGVFYLIFVFLL